MKKRDLKIGGKYKFTGDSEFTLIYMGKEFSNGFWHQFSLETAPMTVWAELQGEDLIRLKEVCND